MHGPGWVKLDLGLLVKGTIFTTYFASVRSFQNKRRKEKKEKKRKEMAFLALNSDERSGACSRLTKEDQSNFIQAFFSQPRGFIRQPGCT